MFIGLLVAFWPLIGLSKYFLRVEGREDPGSEDDGRPACRLLRGPLQELPADHHRGLWGSCSFLEGVGVSPLKGVGVLERGSEIKGGDEGTANSP